MTALYLLACHMVGDFVFQTRWQAARKFTDFDVRVRHVAAYCVAFAPIIVWRIIEVKPGWWETSKPGGFLAGLFVLHLLTDSHRFRSTLGDMVGWQFATDHEREAEWRDQPVYETRGRTSFSLPPNPWSPISMMIDQALHIVQLAVLGAVFLT